MTDHAKNSLINSIIITLNDKIKNDNKILCDQNRYSEQKPLYGSDMLLSLIYASDSALRKIATACGI